MNWLVAWHPQAVRDLRRLTNAHRRRVSAAVDRLAETGQGDVIRLQGIEPPQHLLRVGELRVLFAYASATNTLTVLRVLPRGRAYRG
jgi:mRNA-degrading endonuclease RelE of RelBE toxin-antitoxin system